MKYRYWPLNMGILFILIFVLFACVRQESLVAETERCIVVKHAIADDAFVADCVSTDKSSYCEAVAHWNNRDYIRSTLFAEKAVQQDNKFINAKLLLGWNYIKLSRLKDAEKVFACEILKGNKNDIRAIQGFAWVYLEQGRCDKAEKYFKKLIELAVECYVDDRYISDGYYGLAQLAKNRGNYQEAYNFMSEAQKYLNASRNRSQLLNTFADESQMLMTLGDIYYEDEKKEEAVKKYKEAVRSNDTNLAAQLKLGWANFYTKQYVAAEDSFIKALSMRKDVVESIYGLAVSQYMSGKYNEAFNNLTEAIRIDPYYADNHLVNEIIDKKPGWRTLSNDANDVFLSGKLDENPQWRLLLKEFGMAYYKLGNYTATLNKLEGYLAKINANDYDALIAVAWSYRYRGKLDKAKVAFERAAIIKPGVEEPQIGLGSTSQAEGKTSESLDFYRKALMNNPDSAIPFVTLTPPYSHKKMEKIKIRGNYIKSLSINKDYIDFGWDYYSERQYANAGNAFKKAISLKKEVAESFYGLAMSQYMIEKINEEKGMASCSDKPLDFRYNKGQRCEKALEGLLCDNKTSYDRNSVGKCFGRDECYDKDEEVALCGDKVDTNETCRRQCDKAFSMLAISIKLNPHYADNIYVDGIIDRKPQWRALWKDFGLAYYGIGNYKEAINKLEKYLNTVNASDYDALTVSALSYRWLGNLDKANELSKRAAANDPKLPNDTQDNKKGSGNKNELSRNPSVNAGTEITENKTKVVSDIKVKVLSGTGNMSTANAIARKLKDKGYKIEDIGFASRKNFEGITVYFASGYEEKAKEMKWQLGGNSIIKPLSWRSVFHIIVVAGR